MNGHRMTIFVVMVLACVTKVSISEARQAQDLSAIVAQYYPTALTEEVVSVRGAEGPRKQCFATLESAPTGAAQVIVAGYTNTLSGVVRVLRATANGFELATEADGEDFGGWGCESEAIDLNNDGRKEAVVHFETGNSSEDWVFRWDGVNLQNISPMITDVSGLAGTKLANTSFVDVDGDHMLEAFSSHLPLREGQPLPGEIYRLAGGAFVLDRPIVAMRSFERASGGAETVTHTILLPVGAVSPFTLRIFNGSGMSANGKRVENAIESGRVWWNGQEIVSPNHFGNHIQLIERTVTLQQENELKVRLAGSPGGRIVIVIDAANWAP